MNKNDISSKYKFSILIDFLILTLSFIIILSIVYFIVFLIFDEQNKPVRIVIETEPLDKRYENYIANKDLLYDSLTKRSIGEVEGLEVIPFGEEKIKFIIRCKSSYMPKSNALRTNKLWFEYTAKEDDFHEKVLY